MNKDEIYFVDDDKLEHIKFNRVFKSLYPEAGLKNFQNPQDVVDTIQNKKHNPPRLIILDLNMPEMSGFDVLEILKKDYYLKKIAVVIFTTSENPDDIDKAYDHQVSGYFVKPNSQHQYVKTLETISQYWSLSKTIS